MKIILLGALTLSAACLACSDEGWKIEKQVGGVLHFSNGKKLTTLLHSPKFVGWIDDSQCKHRAIVLEGVGCTDCDANISLYVHNLDDAPMQSEDKEPRYAYPSKLRDFESNKLVAESSTFIGKCLDLNHTVVLWRGYEVVSNTQKPFAFYVEVNGNSIRKIDLTLPSLKAIRTRVKGGECKELPPREFQSEP